jgi:hypothetical protein
MLFFGWTMARIVELAKLLLILLLEVTSKIHSTLGEIVPWTVKH